MKKMRLFGLLMAVIMGVSFTSCEEDEANISITIDSTTPIPTSVTAGETFSFKFVVVSDNNLEEIRFLENYQVLTNKTITEFSAKKSHTGIFSFQTTEETTTLKFAIEVEDSKGNEDIYIFDVLVAGKIETYTAILLGNQSSDNGSFYASSTNTVYKYADSKANAATIDFVYLLDGESNVIAAPSDDFVATKYTEVATWGVKNQTALKITVLSANDFDAIVDDSEIITEANVALSKVTGLTAGEVVAFTTAQGKKGLFKIETIANNTMTIEVKVQK